MKKMLVAMLTVAVLMVCGFIIAIPIVNDNVAEKTAKELVKIPMPEGTEYIESKSRAGKLVGNGNGMQYFGAILIQSELSLEELQEYYSNYADSEWECIVEQQRDNEISVIEHGSLAFESEIMGDKFFVVYSWGSNDSIFNEFDIRGH